MSHYRLCTKSQQPRPRGFRKEQKKKTGKQFTHKQLTKSTRKAAPSLSARTLRQHRTQDTNSTAPAALIVPPRCIATAESTHHPPAHIASQQAPHAAPHRWRAQSACHRLLPNARGKLSRMGAKAWLLCPAAIQRPCALYQRYLVCVGKSRPSFSRLLSLSVKKKSYGVYMSACNSAEGARNHTNAGSVCRARDSVYTLRSEP